MKQQQQTKATEMAVGLALLLLNDVWWKWAYPGWITGKLSDFVGLYIFPLYLCHFAPRYKRWVYGATALLFAWWKSPMANDAIHWLNAHYIPLTRVVDITDYWAFVALVASYYRYYGKRINIPMLRNRLAAIAILCLFGADSIPMRMRTTPVAVHPCSVNITVPLTEETILGKLQASGVAIHRDAVQWGWYYYDTSVYNERNEAVRHDTTSRFVRIKHLKTSTDTFANINLYLTPHDTITHLRITGFDLATAQDTRKRRKEEKRLANVLKMWLQGVVSP